MDDIKDEVLENNAPTESLDANAEDDSENSSAPLESKEDGEVTVEEDSEKENSDSVIEEKNDEVDYKKLMENDLLELKEQFPELQNLESVTELSNPLRYAALRDLGLSAKEAYLATEERHVRDTRAHLSSSVPKGAASPKGSMSKSELESAREIFGGLSDSEIQNLYRKVTR